MVEQPSPGFPVPDALTSLVRETKDALYADQPLLDIRVRSGKVVVEGVYLLLSTMPEHWECGAFAEHKVRVEIASDYPQTEPHVQMLYHSIPWKPDYHCDPRGVCCITVFQIWRASCEDASIKAYFQGPFRNFFLGQYLRRINGKWPFGEWEHGEAGLIGAIADTIGCDPSRKTVRNILTWRVRNPEGITSMEQSCPCGSRFAAADCCGLVLQEFSTRIPAHEAEAWLDRLHGRSANESPFQIKQRIHRNRPFGKVR